MKKFYLILTIIFIFSATYILLRCTPVFSDENIYTKEFSNDEDCLSVARRIAADFPVVNTISVLRNKDSCLCGITTDNNSVILKTAVEKILYEVFPKTKNLKLEVNTDKAEDIIELSYFASSRLKEKYIFLRYDFLISEDWFIRKHMVWYNLKGRR